MNRRVLIVTDFLCTTGFATVAENLLGAMDLTGWTPYIVGINASGDPHPLRATYPHVFPARVSAEHDAYGVLRLPDILAEVKPHLLVIQQDAWNVPLYLRALKARGLTPPPVIAYCPPDAENQPAGKALTEWGVSHLVTPTQFGIRELEKGGYVGPSTVIPYGVDTELFCPGDRIEARKALNYPEDRLDAFVVIRADRNAERKRYDLLLMGFAEFWHAAGQPKDAYLHLHCSIHDTGPDLEQLGARLGIEGQMMFTDGQMRAGAGVPTAMMPNVYRAGNVHVSTAMGEGFGLTSAESAACGIAQVGVNYAALKEIFGDAMLPLPVRGYRVNNHGVNTFGAECAAEDVAKMIKVCYTSPVLCAALGEEARKKVLDPAYTWGMAATTMRQLWEEVAG